MQVRCVPEKDRLIESGMMTKIDMTDWRAKAVHGRMHPKNGRLMVWYDAPTAGGRKRYRPLCFAKGAWITPHRAMSVEKRTGTWMKDKERRPFPSPHR